MKHMSVLVISIKPTFLDCIFIFTKVIFFPSMCVWFDSSLMLGNEYQPQRITWQNIWWHCTFESSGRKKNITLNETFSSLRLNAPIFNMKHLIASEIFCLCFCYGNYAFITYKIRNDGVCVCTQKNIGRIASRGFNSNFEVNKGEFAWIGSEVYQIYLRKHTVTRARTKTTNIIREERKRKAIVQFNSCWINCCVVLVCCLCMSLHHYHHHRHWNSHLLYVISIH